MSSHNFGNASLVSDAATFGVARRRHITVAFGGGILLNSRVNVGGHFDRGKSVGSRR